MSERPELPVNTSFRNASHLIGTLDADGIASVQRDVVSIQNGSLNRSLRTRLSEDSTSSDNSNVDNLDSDPTLVVEVNHGGGAEQEGTLNNTRYEELRFENAGSGLTKRPAHRRKKSVTVRLEKTEENGKYYLSSDDPELRSLLRNTFERAADGGIKRKRSKFSDIVFTRQFTAFDRQNLESAKSAFHGFFTLFWMNVSLLLVKIAANNWRHEGSIFGRNEIVQMMVKRDLMLLGITDGVMCGITVFCLGLQKLVFYGYIHWDKSGWILQNIWQTIYLAAFIGWTRYREWPWTHSILIALHCITMLMKQHSYAFYNGHLSQVYRRRAALQQKLKQLEDSNVLDLTSPIRSPERASATSFLDQGDLAFLHRRRKSMHEETRETHDLDEDITNVTSAMENEGQALTFLQAKSLRRLMKWEIEGLEQELKGKCTVTENYYPKNLNWKDFYGYIPLPTLVYELEYPRQDSINWSYVFEKTLATFGIIGVMIMISTAFIYPVVVHTVSLKEQGLSLSHRLIHDLPWVFMDLLFPLLMEQLLSWYLIWECVLNVLAELTCFADRGFYSDWWNSTSWDYYARTWNVPVHNFLLRHAYHSSISALHLSRKSATLVTFLLSACVHELVMMVLFGKVRGYLFMFQMLQLPLVALSRSRLLKGRDTLGNVVFWLGLSVGPSVLTSLYLFI